MYKNDGLFKRQNKISTKFSQLDTWGRIHLKLNINPGKYQFKIQTQNKKQPLLKSNIETLTIHNKAHFPMWMSFHVEDLSFYAPKNDSLQYVSLQGFSMDVKVFLYRYFLMEIGAIGYFNTKIDNIKKMPFAPNIFSHYALGYKMPIDEMFKWKIKVDPSISLFYRNLPYEFDWQNDKFKFDWQLGWKIDISLLPFYNRSLAFDLSVMQTFDNKRIIIGTGISFTFDVYKMK